VAEFKNPFVLITIAVFVLVVTILIIFWRLTRKKDIPEGLFYEALKNENNGEYEEALTNYEIALTEANKTRHNKNLRIKITEKIKVLHTVIQYQKDLLNLHKNIK
jgi:hypothetical protein